MNCFHYERRRMCRTTRKKNWYKINSLESLAFVLSCDQYKVCIYIKLQYLICGITTAMYKFIIIVHDSALVVGIYIQIKGKSSPTHARILYLEVMFTSILYIICMTFELLSISINFLTNENWGNFHRIKHIVQHISAYKYPQTYTHLDFAKPWLLWNGTSSRLLIHFLVDMLAQ